MVEYGHNWTQVETCDFISRCYDRDTLLVTLLNYGEAWLTGRMICVVGQEHIQSFMTRGWSGWGTDDEITREMGQHKVLLEDSPILETIVEQGTHTIGSSEELGLTDVFEAANVLEPDELIVIPLQLASRTKMLLLGEPKQVPDDLVQFSEELEPLVMVADEVARQLEELIKISKAGKLPPESERIPEIPSRLTEASRTSSTPSYAVADSPSSVILELSVAHVAISEASESSPVSSPPQLRMAPASSDDIAARHTQPIRLQRETTELPSLNKLFDERAKPSKTLNTGESTHMGTPLNMLHEGMSIDIMASEPPVLDKASTLSKLPGSPFEEEPTRSPAPQLERTSQKTAELKGVNIIEPIGLQSGSQRTLMGGFSVADFKRAQERFAQEESKPHVRRPNITLPGVSTPMAQVLRPKRRHKSDEDEDITGYATLKVEAITREYAEQDRQDRLSQDPATHNSPLMMPHQSVTDEHVDIPDIPVTPISEPEAKLDAPIISDAPKTLPLNNPNILSEMATNVTPHVERIRAIGHPEHIPTDELNVPSSTRRMEAIMHDEPPELELVMPRHGQSEVIRTMSKNWAVLFSRLESRDRETAFGVATEFDAHPAVLARLEEVFPGRLYVDRYQWTARTLPPVEKHGPVLATLAHLGEDAAPILIELMSAESLEVRFYATYLVSSAPVEEAIPGLLERIFDRDMQTRKLAAKGLIQLSTFAQDFSTRVIRPLCEIVERHSDDFHVEIAAELLGELRHQDSIPSLINVLDRHKDRLKLAIYTALMKIALQPLPSATIAWRTWHRSALNEPRRDWVLRALVSPSDQIRRLVKHELTELHGDPINYDPDQPQTLRQRSQQELQMWFQTQQ